MCGPGSVVGIATGYGLDGPGIESRWGRDFPHLSRPTMGSTQPPVEWVPGLSRGKEGPGHDADLSPPSTAVVKKEYSYTSTPPMGRTACTEPQCPYKGAFYLLCNVVYVTIEFNFLISRSLYLIENSINYKIVYSCAPLRTAQRT